MNDKYNYLKHNQETFRSSRPEVFCKKGVLRNFTKFTEKQYRSIVRIRAYQ